MLSKTFFRKLLIGLKYYFSIKNGIQDLQERKIGATGLNVAKDCQFSSLSETTCKGKKIITFTQLG